MAQSCFNGSYFFDKNSAATHRGTGFDFNLDSKNEQLNVKLYKPIIRKLLKRKVCSTFKDNIWGTDLAGMQLKSKYNKRILFLLCVIDTYSKYAWVVSLK